MSELSGDYFVNHQRARQFPWSLYHQPLEDSLTRFLEDVARRVARPEVLVIGCGQLHELDCMPASIALTAIDIDERIVEYVKTLDDPRIQSVEWIAPEAPLSSLDRQFDAIYAKEVIEHIVPYHEYLCDLRSILRSDGQVWLSTPNYGEPWLPVLERTILEWVARRSGYSRKHIHPSRFSRRKLAKALSYAGFHSVDAQVVSRRLALVGQASNRP